MTRILDRLTDQLPVDPAPTTETGANRTEHRPFAMRLAVDPKIIADVGVDALVFDDEQQIMMMPDGTDLSPAFKHTSTKTGTSTASQDRSSPDTDSDSTGT